MFLSTQPYKGTRDFYPDELSVRNQVFAIFHQLAHRFGFQEYGGPLLEPFDLYASKTGEEIVNQQLYSFDDRGGRKVAIRPEMTPTLARMVAGKFGELNFPLRWFSIPNLYRYERPQKGRLREHWQFNVDILGGDASLADAEILNFLADLFAVFGCQDKIRIRLNHRGWVNYFLGTVLTLDTERAYRLAKLIDAKEKMPPEEFERAVGELNLPDAGRKSFAEYLELGLPEMLAKYPDSPLKELGDVFARLNQPDVFAYDPVIMRGLDYYTGLVFEGFDRSLSNRRALFGGGRYDNLIGLFGKSEVSGVGFGLGDVVLLDFLSENGKLPAPAHHCDFFVTLSSSEFWMPANEAARVLRGRNFAVAVSLKISALKAQLKSADRSGARFAILFGEEEWKNKKIIVRDLRNSSQEVLRIEDLENKSFS